MGINILQVMDTAKILERAGVCAIEVSGGISEAGGVTIRTAINSPAKEAYFREYSKAIKKAVDIPVILVGGIRSLSVMEHLLEEGFADLISMSRSFICEPYLVLKLKSGEAKKAGVYRVISVLILRVSGATSSLSEIRVTETSLTPLFFTFVS